MECNIFVIRWLYLMSWFLVDKHFFEYNQVKSHFFYDFFLWNLAC